MPGAKTLKRALVTIAFLWSAIGCAHGVRRVKAVDVLTERCEVMASASRLLQVTVMDESRTPLPGVAITAAWGDTVRYMVTNATGSAEFEMQGEPATVRIERGSFFPVEVRGALVERGCRATLAVRLSVDCRHAECD